jgi:hypothetical protein
MVGGDGLDRRPQACKASALQTGNRPTVRLRKKGLMGVTLPEKKKCLRLLHFRFHLALGVNEML